LLGHDDLLPGTIALARVGLYALAIGPSTLVFGLALFLLAACHHDLPGPARTADGLASPALLAPTVPTVEVDNPFHCPGRASR
jgi:hypothetical protein